MYIAHQYKLYLNDYDRKKQLGKKIKDMDEFIFNNKKWYLSLIQNTYDSKCEYMQINFHCKTPPANSTFNIYLQKKYGENIEKDIIKSVKYDNIFFSKKENTIKINNFIKKILFMKNLRRMIL